MCIIFVKKSGVDQWPTEDQVRRVWHMNPDGAGFAWWKKGDNAVSYVRGLMTLEETLMAFGKIKNVLGKDDTVIGHFRVGTSGSISQALTHPFPVGKASAFRSLVGRSQHLFAHNGILSEMPDDKVLSDTAIYVSCFLSKLPLDNTKVVQYIMDKTNGFGRFVLLSHNGRLMTSGNWETDKETGLLWSNLGYRSGYGYYGRNLWDDDDGWDYAAWRHHHSSSPAVTPTVPAKVVTAEADPQASDGKQTNLTNLTIPVSSLKSHVYLPRGWNVFSDDGTCYYQGRGGCSYYIRGDSVLFASGAGHGGWQEIGYVTDVEGNPVRPSRAPLYDSLEMR